MIQISIAWNNFLNLIEVNFRETDAKSALKKKSVKYMKWHIGLYCRAVFLFVLFFNSGC